MESMLVEELPKANDHAHMHVQTSYLADLRNLHQKVSFIQQGRRGSDSLIS